MSEKIKNLGKSTAITAITWAITLIAFVSIFVLSLVLIPQGSIRTNIYQSTVQEPFAIREEAKFGKRDAFIDFALLDIIYNMDPSHPLTSIITDRIYHTRDYQPQVQLMEGIYSKAEPTNEYSRYWHGSSIFVRPLMTFTDLKGATLILGIVTALFLIASAVLIAIKLDIASAIAYAVSFVIAGGLGVFSSIEFVSVFMIVSIMSSVLVVKNGNVRIPVFFAIAGCATAFFDFLTAETLTFTIPMILLISINERDKKEHHIITAGTSWLTAYALTFITKWVAAAIVLPETLTGERLTEKLIGSNVLKALGENIAWVTPGDEWLGKVASIVICIFIAVSFTIIYKKNKLQCGKYLAVCAVIPFIRFILLSGHSESHAFFTHRAMWSSLFAGMMYIWLAVKNKYPVRVSRLFAGLKQKIKSTPK